MKHSTRLAMAATASILLSTPALAHPGHVGDAGFIVGFLHPLGGLDHILAMVAVGVFAARLGGRALWLVPLSFVSMMVAGGLMGFSGIDVPFVKIGIAASVFVLGALVALDAKLPVALAMAIAGGFAIFHGQAHGTELPSGSAPQDFAMGFVLATALLHAVGVGLGVALTKIATGPRTWITRLAGAATAIAGGILATSS